MGIGVQLINGVVVVQVDGRGADLYTRALELRQGGPGRALRDWCGCHGKCRCQQQQTTQAEAATEPATAISFQDHLRHGRPIYPMRQGFAV